MNAQRKVVLERILKGMMNTLEDYSFEQALADIYEYYQAGTFMGAVMAIQADSGAKEKEADQEIKKLVPLTQGQIEDKKTLTKAIGTLSESDLDKVKKAIRAIDPKATPADSLGGAKEQLQEYVREARTPARIAELTKAFKEVGIPLTK